MDSNVYKSCLVTSVRESIEMIRVLEQRFFIYFIYLLLFLQSLLLFLEMFDIHIPNKISYMKLKKQLT